MRNNNKQALANINRQLPDPKVENLRKYLPQFPEPKRHIEDLSFKENPKNQMPLISDVTLSLLEEEDVSLESITHSHFFLIFCSGYNDC